MSECSTEDALSLFVDGKLTGPAFAELEEHLADCEDCRLAAAAAMATQRSGASGPDDEAPSVLSRGAAFGRYTILEPLGAGSMGIVYAAYDAELDRRVAIKFLLVRADDPTMAGRMAREAKAMAKVSHPAVVAVFDAGTLDGRPFVAMELVKGETLSAWCKKETRSVEQILDLFVQCGRGLAAAHAAGIVHRDFKPDNVLVSADGRARVTDFGLARAALSFGEQRPSAGSEPQADPIDRSLTRTGALVGTPAYMAPEQLDGEPATARTDQFSFCVALYEAIYGVRPFQGSSFAELSERIRRGEPGEPTAGKRAPARLRALLLRGLSVDPERRYPSMDALVHDLLAKPGRALRFWLATASVVALSMIGGAVVPTWLARREVHLCTGAERKLVGVWDPERKAAVRAAFGASREPFAPVALTQIERGLDAFAASWIAGHTDACEASRIRGEQSEDVLSLRMTCFDSRLREAKALVNIFAEPDQATVGKAVQAMNALTPLAVCSDVPALSAPVPPPRDPSKTAQIDAVRERLAQGKALVDAGRPGPALTEAETAVTEALQAGYLPVTAEAYYLLGTAQRAKGDAANAEKAFFESLRAAEAGRDDRQVGYALGGLLWVMGTMGTRYAEAHRSAALARSVIERLGGDTTLESLVEGNEGVVYIQEGNFADAQRLLERAVSLRQKAFGADHLEVAKTLTNLGAVYVAEGRHGDATAPYEKALRIFEQQLGAEHPTVATVLNNQIEVYAVQSRFEEARAAAERALAIRERSLGPEHVNTATSLLNLAEVLQKEGKNEAALERYRRVVAIYEKALGPEHVYLADPLTSIGEVELALGHPGEAVALLERALGLRASGDGPYKGASTRFALARALWGAGRDRDRARRLAEEAHTAYAGGGKPFAEDAAHVTKWLEERR